MEVLRVGNDREPVMYVGNTTTSKRGPSDDAAAATAVAQEQLRASSHHTFHDVRCELMDGALVLRGRVSSYYFKQLAQEVVRMADGGYRIVNELQVEDRHGSADNGQADWESQLRQRRTEARRELMDARILIVDDHPTVCESLQFVFAAAGMKQVTAATTCKDAVAAVQRHDVDVILLDLALGGGALGDGELGDGERGDGNGLDTLRAIKAAAPSIPILIHSYHDHARLLARAFRWGVAGYLVKGHDKNVLINAVRQAAAGAILWTEGQMARICEVDGALSEDRTRHRLICQ